MKETFKIMSLMAAAAFLITGCGEKTPTSDGGNPDKISLTVSVDKTSLSVNEEAVLTVKASANVANPLTVTVTAEGNAVSVPATIIIEKDKNEATGSVKGLAEGTSKITISAENAEYGVQYVDVTVKTDNPTPPPTPSGPEIGNLYANGVLSPSSPFFNLICESDSHGKVYPGSLYYHDYDWTGYNQTGIYKSSIDTYGGGMVGEMKEGEGFFTTYPEGTVIDDNLPWLIYGDAQRGAGRFPIIVKENSEYSISDGTHFIVLSLPVDGDPSITGWDKAVNKPCWLKIEVEGMKVTVLDGAMLIGEGEFKVGVK